ncbi:MAG: type II toxin-antitoxin system death-on-curing family toxin [Candidatus Parcubacteria bacterium]|nr:type II toxin-antitoxin system death-on-curing family toxin [Candidatus Parcubacteria bacterium]
MKKEISDLLSSYSKALEVLGQYDEGKLKTIKKGKPKFILKTNDCREIIRLVRKALAIKGEKPGLFGQEYPGKFEGIIKGLYQTFNKKELYKSLEEKSAHLLYFLVKDHPFVDGNKRIAAFLFIYFLSKNNYLFKKDGERKINDNALVALTLLMAISHPREKTAMTDIITNLIGPDYARKNFFR